MGPVRAPQRFRPPLFLAGLALFSAAVQAEVTLPNFLWDMRLERAMGPDLVVNRVVGDNLAPYRLLCWRSQDATPRYFGMAIPGRLEVRNVTVANVIPVPHTVCQAYARL